VPALTHKLALFSQPEITHIHQFNVNCCVPGIPVHKLLRHMRLHIWHSVILQTLNRSWRFLSSELCKSCVAIPCHFFTKLQELMIAVARIVTRRERRRIPQLQNQRARVEGRVFLKVSTCACYIYRVYLSINYIESGLQGEEATRLQFPTEMLSFNVLNMRWGETCRACLYIYAFM
jgi:hypothetical protein